MPETLTLQQALELASRCKTDFHPFGANSFEDLVKDANKRKYEKTMQMLNIGGKDVRIQKK